MGCSLVVYVLFVILRLFAALSVANGLLLQWMFTLSCGVSWRTFGFIFCGFLVLLTPLLPEGQPYATPTQYINPGRFQRFAC